MTNNSNLKEINKFLISKLLFFIFIIILCSITKDSYLIMFGHIYSIFIIFNVIFEIGLPITISNLINEYNLSGYYNTKKKTVFLSKKILFTLGLIIFILMFILSNTIATSISESLNPHLITHYSKIIKIISISFLVIPFITVNKGYLYGNKIESDSNFIEEIIRIICIVFSFIIFKIFKLSYITLIYLITFSFVMGYIVSLIYLLYLINKNKILLQKEPMKIKEPKIEDKIIIKKIIHNSMPFIIINLFIILINYSDVLIISNLLINNIGYSILDTSNIVRSLSIFGPSLNMVICIIFGINVFNRIDYDLKNIEKTVNTIIHKILTYSLPVVLIISIFSTQIFNVIYNTNSLIYQYYIFIVLFLLITISAIIILIKLKEYKTLIKYIIISFALKIVLNIPLLYAFNNMKFNATFGFITSTIISYLVFSILSFYYIGKKYNINYENTIKKILNIIIKSMIIVFIVLIIKYIIPVNTDNRIINLLFLIFISVISITIYQFLVKKEVNNQKNTKK